MITSLTISPRSVRPSDGPAGIAVVQPAGWQSGWESLQEAAMLPRTRELTLVRVQSNNISFGCMAGTIEGTDTPVTLKLLDHRRQRLLGGWPQRGDLVGAQHEVHSVYDPRVLMKADDLQVYELMRHYMPYDLADAYFPVRRELVRVEGL